MSTTVSYKGSTIATITNQTKTLTTAGKWLEADISITDSSSGGAGAISIVDTADSAGGTVRTITAVDISDTTAVAGDVASGKYFYTADGTKTAGTASGGGGEMIITDEPNATGTTAVVTGDEVSLITKSITQNGTYNASSDSADGYSSVTVNVSGGSPSATQHSIYFEFADGTNTTIPVYYNDSLLSTMITAYTPVTYNNKTVTLAQLDGTTWYEPQNIPLNTELVDISKLTADVVLNTSGEEEASQWMGVTDYIVIDPTMTFSVTCGRWYNEAFYDSSKTFISYFSPYSVGWPADPNESNVAVGTIGGNGLTIPSNAMYFRMTTTASADNTICSLIRTA